MRSIRIKLALAMLMATAVSPANPQSTTASVAGPSGGYLLPAEIELHMSLPALLAWASNLSGYPTPETLPRIAYRPRAFFSDRVCGGHDCAAVGWYNDQNVIYLHEKYRYADQDDFANSLLLHELVHFLQHHSERFDSLSCDDSLAREHEAYAVQNDYLVNVKHSFRFIAPKPVSCAY